VNILSTEIEGIFVVENEIFSDHRGDFSRLFCDRELASILAHRQIVQLNLSKNRIQGCVRGMHFQNSPHAEMKMIRCLSGNIFDVAVDLRKDSKTFLKWYGMELSSDNHKMMVIPEGFAHGYQSLTQETEVLYATTSHYEPQSEGGYRFDDPAFNIDWPDECTELSEKDKQHPFITQNFSGMIL